MLQLLRPHLLLVLCSCLLLSACSSTKLAYNNADWLIAWKVQNYIPLNRVQESDLKAALDGHLQWHCQTQLPEYVDWLKALTDTVADRDFRRERLAEHFNELVTFLMRLGSEATPTATRILASLDEEQIDALFENLEEKNQELREEYLEPPLPEQITKRADRLEERLDRWFGRLNPEQRDAIEHWAQQRSDQNRVWLEGRDHWQEGLKQALDLRQEPVFEDYVERLLTGFDFEESLNSRDGVPDFLHKPPEFRATMATSRIQGIDLAQRLLAVSSEQQLLHLRDELLSLRDQFESLSCDQG